MIQNKNPKNQKTNRKIYKALSANKNKNPQFTITLIIIETSEYFLQNYIQTNNNIIKMYNFDDAEWEDQEIDIPKLYIPKIQKPLKKTFNRLVVEPPTFDEEQISKLELPEPKPQPTPTWQPLPDSRLNVKGMFSEHFPTLNHENMTIKELLIYVVNHFTEENLALKKRIVELESRKIIEQPVKDNLVNKIQENEEFLKEQISKEKKSKTKVKTKKKTKKDYTIMGLKPSSVQLEDKPDIILPEPKCTKIEPPAEIESLFKDYWPVAIPHRIQKTHKDDTDLNKERICRSVYNTMHNVFLKDIIIDPKAVGEMRSFIYTGPIYDVYERLAEYKKYWKEAEEKGETKQFEEKYRASKAALAARKLDTAKPTKTRSLKAAKQSAKLSTTN